jgi:dTDP-4-dehydrorhamnose reductase
LAKLLVTGASGLLGANLLLAASADHQVTGVFNKHPIRENCWRSVACDLGHPQAAQELIAQERPEWVIHCAAATVLDHCERDHAWAFGMNRDMAGALAAAAAAAGARMIHISTDAVFGAGTGPFDEDDQPSPPNIYAASKLAGEVAVREAHPGAAIVRTNIIGWGPDPGHGLADWIVEGLRTQTRLPGFDDVAFSPISAGLLARILLQILEKGLVGLYHIPGSTCLSKYDFARQLAGALDFDPDLIVRSSLEGADLIARRGRRLCLRGSRIEAALGISLPRIGQSIAVLQQEWHNGMAATIHGLRMPAPATERPSPSRSEGFDD